MFLLPYSTLYAAQVDRVGLVISHLLEDLHPSMTPVRPTTVRVGCGPVKFFLVWKEGPYRNPVKFVPADQRSDGGRSSFLGGGSHPKKLDGGGAGVCSIQGARGVPMGIQGWRQTWTDVANGGRDGVCGERAGQAQYPLIKLLDNGVGGAPFLVF